MFNCDSFEIIDISQPVSSASACFPGDVPFSRELTLSFSESGVVNLTALTMSPHVGTHADAPAHIGGDMSDTGSMAGSLPLQPFIGQALLVDLSPFCGEIRPEHIEPAIAAGGACPERLLIKTQTASRYDVFEAAYSYFSVDLVAYAGEHGIRLLGIDTPSVDHISSGRLEVHRELLSRQMFWLENLCFAGVAAGTYFLVALPLKLMEVEASPVRAVLLSPL